MKNYSENKNVSRYLPSTVEKTNLFKLINKKPIIPGTNEIKLNPASRSAKLRYGIKLNNHSDFSEFTKKFNYGGFLVGNIFTTVTPNPKKIDKSVGISDKNLEELFKLTNNVDQIVYEEAYHRRT